MGATRGVPRKWDGGARVCPTSPALQDRGKPPKATTKKHNPNNRRTQKPTNTNQQHNQQTNKPTNQTKNKPTKTHKHKPTKTNLQNNPNTNHIQKAMAGGGLGLKQQAAGRRAAADEAMGHAGGGQRASAAGNQDSQREPIRGGRKSGEGFVTQSAVPYPI